MKSQVVKQHEDPGLEYGASRCQSGALGLIRAFAKIIKGSPVHDDAAPVGLVSEFVSLGDFRGGLRRF